MSIVNKDDINFSIVFPIIARYTILAVLYIIVFFYFKYQNIQFILFIVLFILNFFTIVFLGYDFASSQELMKMIANPAILFDFTKKDTTFAKIFVFAIFIVLLMQICSISIILAVFDYGKTTLNDYLSHQMTTPNTVIINETIRLYNYAILILFIFAYTVLFSYSSEIVQSALLNIGGIMLSMITLALASYNIYLSVEFLKTREKHQQLYE